MNAKPLVRIVLSAVVVALLASPGAAARRVPGSLDCEVEVRVIRIEKQAAVTAEIARDLNLGQDTVGRLGVAEIRAGVVTARPAPGTKDGKDAKDSGCSELAGHTGTLILRYQLGDARASKLTPESVVWLHYWALPAFPAYGVAGTEAAAPPVASRGTPAGRSGPSRRGE